ncbi:hypothetical protein EDD18DRAFT_1347162 [Armillaria luteobubalina]|uniref:Uncharacterized protein n=1 Tax=Armillaria luteobubalina TaxID=153913 RepID=A0AA39UXZ5_9AGAR|nr:hypothetical protein EDD18DRAFT_1347162 [Armillaria luteobubalina]
MAMEYYDPYNPQSSAPFESHPFHDKNGQEHPKKSWFYHGLCFVLHTVLACAHILILLVWITHIEHKVVFPIGK